MDDCEAGDCIARKSTDSFMDGDGIHKDMYSYMFTWSKRWDSSKRRTIEVTNYSCTNYCGSSAVGDIYTVLLRKPSVSALQVC